jgi:hypothetical protein
MEGVQHHYTTQWAVLMLLDFIELIKLLKCKRIKLYMVTGVSMLLIGLLALIMKSSCNMFLDILDMYQEYIVRIYSLKVMAEVQLLPSKRNIP